MRCLGCFRKPAPLFSLRRYPIAWIARRTVSIPTGSSNFSTISASVISGRASIVFAIFSKASCPSTRLRPLLLTRRSTLPVLAFCSASRYTVGTDTPYTNAIPFASCVFSYASTSKFPASLCSIFLSSMLFYHICSFIAISENCSNIKLQQTGREAACGRLHRQNTAHFNGLCFATLEKVVIHLCDVFCSLSREGVKEMFD